MTEAEIMKEIETFLQIARFVNSDYVTSPFETKVLIAIQDLINRKNAEIERVTKERDNITKTYTEVFDAWQITRAEAIKEALEMVKKLLMNSYEPIDDWDIDQIAKEMGVEL